MIETQAFLQIINSTPLVSVDLLMRNGAGEVLLGRRLNRPCQGHWFVPGGIVRKNELIRNAVKRIAKAELGVSVSFDGARFRGVFEHLYDENFLGEPGINTHYIVLAYEFCLPKESPPVLDDQHAEARWWRIEDLLQHPGVHENTKAYFSLRSAD